MPIVEIFLPGCLRFFFRKYVYEVLPKHGMQFFFVDNVSGGFICK